MTEKRDIIGLVNGHLEARGPGQDSQNVACTPVLLWAPIKMKGRVSLSRISAKGRATTVT